MKRFIAILIFLCGSIAYGGTWEYIGRGVYRGDSYYWSAYQNCGKWYYQKLAPIVQLPDVGSPDFWTEVAKLNARSDEIQDEASYVKSRWPGSPVNVNTITTGYNVLAQGYQPNLVQSGTTIQTTGPSYLPIDLNAILHEAERSRQIAGLNSSEANAQVDTIVNNLVAGSNAAIAGNTEQARILAAGQVAAALISATAPPPVTSTTVFQSQSASANNPVPSQGSGGAVALLSHGLAMQYCSKCHNQNKLSGGIDMTVDPAALAPVRDKIEAAIRSGKMPKGGPPLIEAVQNGLLAGIPHSARPPVATPPQPSPPPVPMPPPGGTDNGGVDEHGDFGK